MPVVRISNELFKEIQKYAELLVDTFEDTVWKTSKIMGIFKQRVKLITRAPFYKGIKRYSLIALEDDERVVVSWQSLEGSVNQLVTAGGFEPPALFRQTKN